MITDWLPHWTTLIALGCGVAGALYPGSPPAPKGPEPRDFQEKHVRDLAVVMIDGLFVISLVGLGSADLLFLAIGWSRSPWPWNVAGAVSLLWIVGRLGQFWKRLPDPKGTPPAVPSATVEAKPVAGEDGNR